MDTDFMAWIKTIRPIPDKHLKGIIESIMNPGNEESITEEQIILAIALHALQRVTLLEERIVELEVFTDRIHMRGKAND